MSISRVHVDNGSTDDDGHGPRNAKRKKSYFIKEMERLGVDPIASGFMVVPAKNGTDGHGPIDCIQKLDPGPQSTAETCCPIPNGSSTNEGLQNPVPKIPSPGSPLTTDDLCNHIAPVQDAEVIKTSRTRPNPFKLIPCQKYGDEIEAPFRLLVSIEALAVIDIHAHCVQNEVIGLLGGRFCSLLNQLQIISAEPCESLTATTTDLQCEMDPVSQALASERLSKAGCKVVGWYHSHPTFVPNPSLRDLETQAKYQTLFAEGNQPFLAIILNPFSPTLHSSHKSTLISNYKCLMVSDQYNAQNDYRVPYEFTPILIRTDKLFLNLKKKLEDLCPKISNNSSKWCMHDKVKGKNLIFINKLNTSLKYYFEQVLSHKEADHLLDQIKLVLFNYLSKN